MTIESFISKTDIEKRVKILGEQITKDYKGEEIIILGVLTGSVIFVSDLIREIKTPLSLEFIKASSYGDSTKSSGVTMLSATLSPIHKEFPQGLNPVFILHQ